VVLAGLVAAASTCLFRTSTADACSPGQLTAFALPRTGTTGVSTETSMVVVVADDPSGLSLTANGQNVPLSFPSALGRSGGGGAAWQVRAATPGGMLVGGAEHVLSKTLADGTSVELTRFTTAAGYDKVQGTAPVLHGLRLWRVRYPVADINSGNCVFAEYEGFITVDYDPATVPNTDPSSVVYGFDLVPENGGSPQRLVQAGEPFVGGAPAGTYPLPVGPWQPELDPTRRYCLSISAFGDGDLARLPLPSERVCADVEQLSALGAPPPPQIRGGATNGGGGGGCAVAAAAPVRCPPLAALLVIAAAIGLGCRRR
jgi:hypothetical protein